MKKQFKWFICVSLFVAFGGVTHAQSYQELMEKRVYWPQQITITKAFDAKVVTSAGRSMGEVGFTIGRRVGYTGPYQKKAGFMVIKVGTSFALAPIDHTDFLQQIKTIQASGTRDARPNFNQSGGATATARPNTAAPAAAAGPKVPGMKALLEMKVVKGKANRHDNTDYDNQSQTVIMKVDVTSREFRRQYQGAEARIYVLAKSAAANMKDRAYKVISKKTHEFDLLPGKTVTFQTDSVSLQYDDSDAAKFGDKFYGYLLEIYEDGQLVTSQSSPSTLKKYAATVRSQTVSAGYSSYYFRLQ